MQICTAVSSIDDFYIDFIKCVHDPVEASLVEARFIDLLKPKMNRRHETGGTVVLTVT